ncbi:uncharacterized protein [Hemitrygon akajei]|uniref:uncharacterized protein isoform X3 n=1 Tax=Hemitrygon akajei TaxID=2704970 RepID=UPI003BF97AE8
MDDSETYVNVKFTKTDTETPFRAAQERESTVKIENRPYRLICLLCLVTSALIVIVAGLSIHISQIRQSKVTCDRSCHEINSTVESKASLFNSNLSDLNRLHNDLRHQFTEVETKYRSVNETKAQICELLTSRRGMWAGVSCTSRPLERPSAFSAKGVTLVIMIGISSARGRHLCSRIFLKRSRVSANSQWSRHESSDYTHFLLLLSPSLSLPDAVKFPPHPLCPSLLLHLILLSQTYSAH